MLGAMQDRSRPLARRTLLLTVPLGAVGAGAAGTIWWRTHSNAPDIAADDPVAAPGDPIIDGTRWSVPAGFDQPHQVVFTPDGTALTWIDSDGAVHELDPVTGKVGSAGVVDGATGRYVLGPDGATAAGVENPDGTDPVVIVRDRGTGRSLAELSHPDPVDLIVYSMAGTHLFTRTFESVYRSWTVRTGMPLGEPVDADFGACAISPDGRQLAVESGFQVISVWDVAAHDLVHELDSAPAADRSLAFVPDTGLLAAPTLRAVDGQLRLWDLHTGQDTGVLVDCAISGGDSAKDVSVVATATDATGRLIAAGTTDGSVRIWVTASGKVLGPSLRMRAGLSDLALSPDGTVLAALGEDGAFTVWRIGGFRTE
jgi:WD40 repeat protein